MQMNSKINEVQKAIGAKKKVRSLNIYHTGFKR